MKPYLLPFFLIFLWLPTNAQPIKFINNAKSWNEIIQTATELKKPIFVDIYTTWCGPCKKMDQEVFSDHKVGSYFNLNFLNIKIDAEKGWGKQFINDNQVNSFPTYLYFDEKGNLLFRSLGYMAKDLFIKQGQRAILDFKNKSQMINYGTKLDSVYYSKNYDFHFLYKYIKFQGKIRANRCALIEEYLSKVPKNNLTSDSVMNLIYSESGNCLIKPESNILSTLISNYKIYPIKSSWFQSPYNILMSKVEQAIDSTDTKNYSFITGDLMNIIGDNLYDSVDSKKRQLDYLKARYYHKTGVKDQFLMQFKIFCDENLNQVDTAKLYSKDLSDFEKFYVIEKSKNAAVDKNQLSKQLYSEASQITKRFISLHKIYKSHYKDEKIENELELWMEKCYSLYAKNPVYAGSYYLNILTKMINDFPN